MTFKTTVHIDQHRNVNKQPMVFTVYTLNTLHFVAQWWFWTWWGRRRISHEINIILGILFFTQKYSLCLHASDEISGSDIDMLLKDFKNCWWKQHIMVLYGSISRNQYPHGSLQVFICVFRCSFITFFLTFSYRLLCITFSSINFTNAVLIQWKSTSAKLQVFMNMFSISKLW